MTIDPVCGMEVIASNTEETAEYEGVTYRFCSTDCHDLFVTAPAEYVETPHPHLTEVLGVAVPRLPYGRAKGEFDVEIREPGTLGVGDRVAFTKAITDDDVRKFAEATSDTNAVHLNDAFAEKTRFGRRIVHGTLVSGMISAALACFPGLSIYLSQNVEFSRPVDVGETLTARCEIVEALENDRYRLTTRVENEAEEIVVHGTATVLIDELPE
ncbi:MaoC/PaaZ C-terminal domain-containing protein [Halomarina pelagica]|uniref:MaoC/PaaZ C-terminal domain-containing protein n=1 Tax=Halomarina pelagica TaxID=2961599 RepID=UPI0020C2EEB4|nr:MaoC/PaaZ C-terminal domain-containing protein [Halomarina sp. BND7]